MKTHERLLKAVKAALDDLYYDTSVSQEQTLESINDLKDEIENLIEAIIADIGDD